MLQGNTHKHTHKQTHTRFYKLYKIAIKVLTDLVKGVGHRHEPDLTRDKNENKFVLPFVRKSTLPPWKISSYIKGI